MSQNHSRLVIISTNTALDYIGNLPEFPCAMPPEMVLSEVTGISRTTVGKVISVLVDLGIARIDNKNRILLRRPVADDYLALPEVPLSKAELTEAAIREKLHNGELAAGKKFSELEIAKNLNTSTVLVREALLKTAQSGFIYKHPHQGWEVVSFNPERFSRVMAARKAYNPFLFESLQQAGATDQVWDEWENLEQKIGTEIKSGNFQLNAIVETESKLYRILTAYSGNEYIEEAYDRLLALTTFALLQNEVKANEFASVFKELYALAGTLAKRDIRAAETMSDTFLDAVSRLFA